MQQIDLTGQVFERLTVVERDHVKDGLVFWKCLCTCGQKILVRTKSLRSGNTKSCGCLQKQRAKEANTTHGFCTREQPHPMYEVWCNMKNRCNNPSSNRYYIYGARGIKVEPEWATFEQFKADMLPTWQEGLTLERKDTNGNYCKDNCIWATTYDQARNMSTNHWLTFNGKTQILQDWATELEMTHCALLARLKAGWTLTEVLTTKKYARR